MSSSLVQIGCRAKPPKQEATPGFQAGSTKNPDGSPGKSVLAVSCGKGCPISDECARCPANKPELLAGTVQCFVEALFEPFRWKERQNTFLCPEGDPFHKDVPYKFLCQMFAMMESCWWHRFVMLTKRAREAEKILTNLMFPVHVREAGIELFGKDYVDRGNKWGDNIVFGVSVGRQKYIWRTEILPNLPKTMTTCIFVAPMLEHIDLLKHINPVTGWVSCSAERGSWGEGAPRPCDPQWQKDLKDQCVAAGIPFYLDRHYDEAWLDEMDGTWQQLPRILKE